LTDLATYGIIGYSKERTVFEIFQQDDGLVHRLKELREFYKKADEKEKNKQLKTKDSILRKVLKIYPGM
tara:strand:- start:364 stop:570 length:207 start_codon:yes stop_codon:yes gene_type:complete